MSALHHNPENERTIRRMAEGGMTGAAIARKLGVTRSTVYWHLDKWYTEHPLHMPDDGPVAIDRPTCRVCSGASATWEGHDCCTGKGRRAEA